MQGGADFWIGPAGAPASADFFLQLQIVSKYFIDLLNNITNK